MMKQRHKLYIDWNAHRQSCSQQGCTLHARMELRLSCGDAHACLHPDRDGFGGSLGISPLAHMISFLL